MLTTRNCHFNPRSLTGATFDIHVFSTQISISIHAPSRERRCCSISIGIPHIFQSTLPRGSDYLTATELLSIVEFQSTLPRGSDATSSAHCAATSISIHAPSRERRIGFNKTFDTQGFQSTLPRGSDNPTRRPQPQERLFQSTLPRGSDDIITLYLSLRRISIHAPSRERRTGCACIHIADTFQSTLPRGSDLNIILGDYLVKISIHAPSRERRVGHIDKHHCRNFNPRSLAGATQISERYTSSHQFQSTLPRGSDWKCSIKIIGITISIHAPSRERPEIAGQIMTDEYISIHAPSRERLLGQIVGVSRQLFQSTLPRGSDVRAL